MNDHYEDFLIREMTEPENPEGELDPTELPGWGEEPNPYTDIIDPESLDYSRGVEVYKTDDGKLHFRPKVTGVHNSGGDVRDPALPESPSNFTAAAPHEVVTPTYDKALCRSGSESLSLDQTESACQWFDQRSAVADEQRGAESNAYNSEESDARRKEWHEND